MGKVTAAIIQAKPIYLNLKASIEKAIHYIDVAVNEGAELIAFGETWLTGYPSWLGNVNLLDLKRIKEVFALLRQNSPTILGPEISQLRQVAKKYGIIIIMGLNERVDEGPGHGTLYNSLITIGTDSSLLNHHRKLVPTFKERLIWGHGDGDGLIVPDTAKGKIGGLVCWEHWMPLTRQALHNEAEQIHIAAWPHVIEEHLIASRYYAVEGRCFVLATGAIESVKDLPIQLQLPYELKATPDKLLLKGGSAIIDPNGNLIAGPIYDEETILVGDIDLNIIEQEKLTNVLGHNSFNDIFTFKVNKNTRC